MFREPARDKFLLRTVFHLVCFANMSYQPCGGANDGSRPKCAFPNTPSWLPTTAVAKPPPPPPPPMMTESQQAEQVSPPTRPCASITCTVGQMSTRVDFANIQDFDRFGMQILQQAHLASMCMAAPPTAPPCRWCNLSLRRLPRLCLRRTCPW